MKRHNIAKTLQRLAEIREQQALSAASIAHQQLDAAQTLADELLMTQTEQEQALVAGRETPRGAAILGATFHLLELGRVGHREQMRVAEAAIVRQSQAADVARSAHQSAMWRTRSATKVHDHIRSEWRTGVQQKMAQDLEESARAYRTATVSA